MLLRGGAWTPLADVAPYDEVLAVDLATGVLEYSTIFTWAHYRRSTAAPVPYIRLVTASGAALTLSREHYTFAVPRGCDAASGLRVDTLALTGEEMRVGFGLWVLSEGASALVCSDIVAIEAESSHGLYAPLTLGNTLVVDGVLASAVTSYDSLNRPFFGVALARRLPSLRFDALTPPMAVHAALFARVYRRWGQRGLDVAEALNAPVYWLAGVEQPSNHEVHRLWLASRSGPADASGATAVRRSSREATLGSTLRSRPAVTVVADRHERDSEL